MSQELGTTRKRELIKNIIKDLHAGLEVEAAKDRFVEEVGTVTATEIGEIEQQLIGEGMSPDEIKRFCNVHALLFEEQLRSSAADAGSESHPVSLFQAENREIMSLTDDILSAAENLVAGGSDAREAVAEQLERLRPVDIHYKRKEQVLFPFLERHDFGGPSTVMWGKHDDIRAMLKTAIAGLADAASTEEIETWLHDSFEPMVEEVRSMVTKEENILFPASLERLTEQEWVEVLKSSDEIGYAFIDPPSETDFAVKDLRALKREGLKVESTEQTVRFPSGALGLDELLATLNCLPVDITYVGADDRVRYFSEGPSRVFPRPRAIIGRRVQDCHPPKSIDRVKKILEDLKSGRKNHEDFWLELKGRFIHIRYLALRGNDGRYMGTVEVTQDLTELRALKGEKRLVPEG